MSSGINRPFKYGVDDKREFIVQNSEVACRAINDTNGNPIFLGRAKAGILIGEDKWQIRKIRYDSNQGVSSVQWAQDSDNIATTDFKYIWSTVSELTITNVTIANPGVITVSAIGSLVNGDKIVIQDVAGMTELNFDGSNIYTVANIAGATFELSGINTTTYAAYTSGGTINYGEVVGYTYS